MYNVYVFSGGMPRLYFTTNHTPDGADMRQLAHNTGHEVTVVDDSTDTRTVYPPMLFSEMAKVETATAIYTGGGIYVFTGTLSDGTYFIADDEGSFRLVDADPDDAGDDAWTSEWQEEHLIIDLNEQEYEVAMRCTLYKCIDAIESGVTMNAAVEDLERRLEWVK